MLLDVKPFYRVKRSKTSAGLLMFRRKAAELELLLVHPGGPFFRNKENGAWTIPKGEVVEGEELLERAKVEFKEELGIEPAAGEWIELGTITQKGGKTVHGWAFEGDLPEDFALASNTFSIEWPPRSGRTQQFPEIDRAEFFPIELAKEKINQAQIEFLDRLVEHLNPR
ncbi:MAG TPA: NUDIX domain-containing protein [Chthoniobacterales bacterium]|jgi:predicted NUDIX family NTP pyrophosphohydrolase|nr:NUDIX domain-containing protein [Chthoniobacterales bacterium]